MARGRDLFRKFRYILIFFTIIVKLVPRGFRIVMFQNVRGVQGKLGIGVRYILLKTLCCNCGDNVSVHSDVYLLNVKKLSLGSNISIHPFCYLDASGEISIDDNVSIAHGVSIMSTSHNYADLFIPIKDQGITAKKTKIYNNVWIGAKSTLLMGVSVESGAIVGANSVVSKNVETNSIVGGVPAKLIKIRG